MIRLRSFVLMKIPKIQKANVSKKKRSVPAEDCPYFTGKPYMISSDTVLKAAFKQFFAKEAIQAAIYLPIEVKWPHGNVFKFL